MIWTGIDKDLTYKNNYTRPIRTRIRTRLAGTKTRPYNDKDLTHKDKYRE